MKTEVKTVFICTQTGEKLRTVQVLLDYKEGETIMLEQTPKAGEVIPVRFEVVERMEDKLTLYGHEVIREIRICKTKKQ